MFFTAAILLTVATAASASIEANLAYLSPSKQVRSLAIDTTHLKKRTLTGTYKGSLNFTYGVASGDPEPNSVILWTHPVPSSNTTLPVCLNYAVSYAEDMSTPVTRGQVWTSSEVDYSAKVEAFGLQPWKEYYYQFSNCASANNTSPIGAFKTIPQQDDDQISDVSLAVYSCSNLPFGYFNAYGGPVARKSVDFVVHVGDYIYEEQGDGSPNSYGNGTALDRVPLPNKELVSLFDYRTRYACYRKDLDLQELHRTHAWQLVWDDHEVADNSYNAGTADSNNTAAGLIENTTFTERKANAVRAYFEWQPIRQVDTNDHLRIWRKFRFGTLADLFMLDTRQYDRDITDVYYNTKDIAAMSGNQNRSLMGSRQEQWFYDSLVQSKQDDIQWKIVGQQIVYANINYSTPTFQLNYDSWSGYQSNRQRVLNTIADNSINNVVFLAGDSHLNWVSDLVSVDAVRNGSYDQTTGSGSLGVEFAGTAVSSPSAYGQNLNISTYTAAAQRLANVNAELQWAEGAYRGYFELALSRSNATATFIAYPDVRTRNQNYTILATFTTEKDSNKLSRPIAGGYIQGGAVKKA